MRREDWQPQLRAELERAASEPFEWGRTDCCMFAARCIDAMTGSTWETELRQAYQDKRSALVYLAEEGGLEEALTRRFGRPVAWWHARRGDLVLLPAVDGRGSLGICYGHTAAAVLPDRGLCYVPITSASAAWRVL